MEPSENRVDEVDREAAWLICPACYCLVDILRHPDLCPRCERLWVPADWEPLR